MTQTELNLLHRLFRPWDYREDACQPGDHQPPALFEPTPAQQHDFLVLNLRTDICETWAPEAGARFLLE